MILDPAGQHVHPIEGKAKTPGSPIVLQRLQLLKRAIMFLCVRLQVRILVESHESDFRGKVHLAEIDESIQQFVYCFVRPPLDH